jgi:hypothetical protein
VGLAGQAQPGWAAQLLASRWEEQALAVPAHVPEVDEFHIQPGVALQVALASAEQVVRLGVPVQRGLEIGASPVSPAARASGPGGAVVVAASIGAEPPASQAEEISVAPLLPPDASASLPAVIVAPPVATVPPKLASLGTMVLPEDPALPVPLAGESPLASWRDGASFPPQPKPIPANSTRMRQEVSATFPHKLVHLVMSIPILSTIFDR